jgi:ABC-type glycerol-3-phosphate transport system permease component
MAVARRVAYSLSVWAVVLVVAFPLFWMVSTALKPQSELFAIPPALLPEQPTLEHFAQLLFHSPFPTYLANSAIVSVATTLVVIAIGTLGAHSLVRFRYPGRERLAQLVLFTYLLPPVVLVIPLYLLMAKLGLVNSLASLIITYTTFALPFALWLLRSFMEAIPADLEAAAQMDGANRMQAFVDIILPQALPGIISTALFSFILAWNEYLFALVLISRDSTKPLPTGVITMLTSAFQVEWSLLMAASVLMSVPLVICFAFLQKHLTAGFGAGSVKG